MRKFKNIILGAVSLLIPFSTVSCLHPSFVNIKKDEPEKEKPKDDTENKDKKENDNKTQPEKPPVTNPQQPPTEGNKPKEGNVDVDDGGRTPSFPGSTSGGNTRIQNGTKPKEAIDDIDAYNAKSITERYYIDEKPYYDSLSRNLFADANDLNNDIKKYIGVSSEFIVNFDARAKELNQPEYRDSLVKNFTLVNENNKLIVNPFGEIYTDEAKTQTIGATRRTWYWDTPNGDRGTARQLPNQLYKNTLLQTYSLRIRNENPFIKSLRGTRSITDLRLDQGTAWIIDYQLSDTGYPTKFYLATNLHVAAAILKKQADDSVYTNVITEAEMRTNAQNLIEKFDAFKASEAEKMKYESEYIDLKNQFGENDPKAKEVLAKYYEVLPKYNSDKKAYNQAEDKIKGYTTAIDFIHFDWDTPLKTELKQTIKDPNGQIFSINDLSKIKLVYAATDFLTTSPSEYLTENSPYKDLQEMADFAILEVDLTKNNVDDYMYYSTDYTDETKYKYTYIKDNTNLNPADYASAYSIAFTSGFANKDSELKSQPASFDLLSDYQKISDEALTVEGKETSKINYDFIALGFPNSYTDPELVDNEKSAIDKDALKLYASLWVNKPSIYRDNGLNASEYGYGLSKNLGLRTFIDKPGVTDLMISNPLIYTAEKQGFPFEHLSEKDGTYSGKRYLNYGLAYVLEAWQPGQGASGSSVRDIDGNILGITFAAADSGLTSLISLSQALRSPGYNYNGLYGDYNLEQYDLIYGGGRNQRTSYRQALQRIYGNTYKTKLFPNGPENIPEEYRFKNS
ncbi:DUF31 family protein [Mycoplasma sp. Pen4]|uniref:Ig-specific serine endopeptidase MIP n=1 Tax=Mycoplasma sp. Pen4 TaxID=640330 RepID=UPI001653F2C0|nr:DUF31 family protein [Mycoplasma sp. Pen4]QNM93337.1 DUF31 family protein [Mycoplasma sp. Pen4]